MQQARGAVLVTGAARRVGAAIARALAADGWNVIIHYNRSVTEAHALAERIRRSGGRCSVIEADLACHRDAEALLGRCVSEHGDIDCLINNASVFSYDNIETVTWNSLHENWSVNLAAPLLLCRDFARLLGDRTGGCIINLLDQKVENLNPDFLSYTVSKVALSGLTDILAMAFAGRIRVCGIAPGLALISGKQTETSFRRAWKATPLQRSTTPDEIADCVRFIVSSPTLTGNTIFLDGGERLRGRARDVAFDPAV